jgi:hypothetical protein
VIEGALLGAATAQTDSHHVNQVLYKKLGAALRGDPGKEQGILRKSGEKRRGYERFRGGKGGSGGRKAGEKP